MSNSTTVQVTKDHIENGTQGKGAHCPIALAIKEQITDAVDICVWTDEIYISRANDHCHTPRRYQASTGLTNWIANFEAGAETPPITISFDKLEQPRNQWAGYAELA